MPISWGHNIATPDYFLLQYHNNFCCFFLFSKKKKAAIIKQFLYPKVSSQFVPLMIIPWKDGLHQQDSTKSGRWTEHANFPRYNTLVTGHKGRKKSSKGNSLRSSMVEKSQMRLCSEACLTSHKAPQKIQRSRQ